MCLMPVSLNAFTPIRRRQEERPNKTLDRRLHLEKHKSQISTTLSGMKRSVTQHFLSKGRSRDKTDAQKYLNAAKYYYYQASRIDLSNQDSFIGMARISLYQGQIRDAKNTLMIALNINENNPKVSYYLGEAFFMEGEYFHAIDFYNWAYSHGYQKDYKTNYKLGVCFEKLDDISKARFHYQNALNTNPSSTQAQKRLKGLDAIDTDYKNIKNKDIKYNEKDSEILNQSDLDKINTPNL